MSKKRFVVWTLLFLVVVAMPLAAVAQGTSSTNPQDQPTSVLHAFDNVTSSWIQSMHGFALRLFFLLAGIDVVWLGILLVLEHADMQHTLAKVIKKVLTIGFFLALLENGSTWVKAIIDSFSQIGIATAGLNGGVTPSEILFTGVQISSQIFASFAFSLTGVVAAAVGGAVGGGVGAGIGLLSLFCGVCIFLGYAVITITFIMAKIES
jgi:type IV secretion system protein TrbL